MSESHNDLLVALIEVSKGVKVSEFDFVQLLAESDHHQISSAFAFLTQWVGSCRVFRSKDSAIDNFLFLKEMMSSLSQMLPLHDIVPGSLEGKYVSNHPYEIRASLRHLSDRYWLSLIFYRPSVVLNTLVPFLNGLQSGFAIASELFVDSPPEAIVSPLDSTAITNFIRKMLIGNAPAVYFAPILKHRAAKQCLTRAVISILDEYLYSDHHGTNALFSRYCQLFMYFSSPLIVDSIEMSEISDYLYRSPVQCIGIKKALALYAPMFFAHNESISVAEIKRIAQMPLSDLSSDLVATLGPSVLKKLINSEICVSRYAVGLTAPILTHLPASTCLVKTCLPRLMHLEPHTDHLILSKTLMYQPRMPNTVNDHLALLEYADSLLSIECYSIQEQKNVSLTFNNLLKTLGIPKAYNTPFLLIDPPYPSKSPLSILEDLSPMRIEGLCNVGESEYFRVLRLITFSSRLKKVPIAGATVSKLQLLLNRMDLVGDAALTVSQHLLPRLLVLYHTDLALSLLDSMQMGLIADPAPLHWIVRFVTRYRDYLTVEMRAMLGRCVASLPYASNFFFSGLDTVHKIAEALSSINTKSDIYQDRALNEYASEYEHAQAFALCSLMLSPADNKEIAGYLIRPLQEDTTLWKDRRTACLTLSKISGLLNEEIGIEFFKLLMSRRPIPISIDAGRMFILSTTTHAVTRICSNVSEFIDDNSCSLTLFLQVIVAAMNRLDKETAETFIEQIAKITPDSADIVDLLKIKFGI